MREWHASWIGPAYDPKQDFGLYWFETSLELAQVPKTLPVRISADQRYCLLVNGAPVHRGPQRGDARHWFFDEIDLANYLKRGRNSIRAAVWNFGWMAPMAQHSVRTGFLLEADPPYERLSTPGAWKVTGCDWFDFKMMNAEVKPFYVDVGPGEIHDLAKRASFESEIPWQEPHVISRAESRGQPGGGAQWSLIPRTIPELPLGPEQFAEHCGDGVYDFGVLKVGYPQIKIFADEPAEVVITYAEAPVDAQGQKGNRNTLDGKRISGYQDVVKIPAGASQFEPLWIRTCRYIHIEVRVSAWVESVSMREWRYPLLAASTFGCDDPAVEPIWQTCIRTLELCAGETYFDCPYYEQLQYVGDARIQALCGYYLSTDRALQRNCIEQIGWSLLENGLTQSRYPSRQMQVIPPFSLWWVMMLYDAYRYDSPDIAMRWLDAAELVISAFKQVQHGELEPFWCFGDWVPGWKWGIPPGGPNAEMHQLTLQLAEAALDAMRRKTMALDWPAERIRPDQSVTEHAEALWRYGQRLAGQNPDPWPDLDGAARCTYYFQYYSLFGQAPEDYVSNLEPWQEMLKLGLTTFAENPEPTRSDCHAWSAHPVVGLLREVAGIDSAAPGWAKLRVAPRPGSLERFEASMAHPCGPVGVHFESGKLSLELPIPAVFEWQGEQLELDPGKHEY
jgi:alpha-L-rhamnosidase